MGCVYYRVGVQAFQSVTPYSKIIILSHPRRFSFIILQLSTMLSTIRTAAIASVARPTAARLSMMAASRRLYATDQADQDANKEDQQQKQKQDENKDAAAASPEDAAAKALAEKDKKISELQVSTVTHCRTLSLSFLAFLC